MHLLYTIFISEYIAIYYLMGEKVIRMAGYYTSVGPYYHEPQASENTAQRTLAVSHARVRMLVRPSLS